jgi:catechol 2,3-dioxygenase-like lactoylglutathione lyase family enzyme
LWREGIVLALVAGGGVGAVFLFAFVLLSLGLIPASADPMVGRVERVAAVGVTVSDMDRALAFYTGVLGCSAVADVEEWGDDIERLDGVFGVRKRVVHVRLGDETLVLTDYLTAGGRPIPPDSHSNDGWFQHAAIVVSDMDAAYRWLRAHRVVHASTGPQRLPDWNPAAGGIRAFYFRDPDDHNLEIIWFPAGKGDPKWQARAAQARSGGSDRGVPAGLFLGIDHTAIVVRDTEASLQFYAAVLGLQVSGHSENHGSEQEHLNNVRGARLRITGLRAGAGPGIEFLEYLSPRDGRPYPSDARADDLIHWQTVLVSSDVGGLAQRLQAAGAVFVSPGPVTLDDTRMGFETGFRVRDPDGHVMEVTDSWQTFGSTASPRF